MKKIFITILTLVAISSFASSANAQMMMGGFSNSTEDWDKVVAHTLEEEKEGKEVWGKIQAKEITCAGLREDDHGVL